MKHRMQTTPRFARALCLLHCLIMSLVLSLILGLYPGTALQAHETGFPEETLKKVFPEATGFTLRKKTLTPAQLRRAEQLSGSKVQRNDNPLVLYVALGRSGDGSGVLGTVLMLDTRGPIGGIDLAVGYKRDGSVNRVVVVENADDPGLGIAGFLDQIQGKGLEADLSAGQDIQFSGEARSAQALLNAVRRGMYFLEAAGLVSGAK
ncbi:MAG: hypothetical protein V3T65_00270 [Acidobacteriota bacterium]